MPPSSECEVCDGTGYVPVYAAHLDQCVAAYCPTCAHGPIAPHLYRDDDEDGWLDGVPRAKARYSKGVQALDAIDTVVLHRLQKGWHHKGPAYVSNPDRVVSWHFTAHRPGWTQMITQHLPLHREAFHARGHNENSIGVETDGPHDAPWADETVEAVVRLVESLVVALPRLRRVVSHRHLSPGRRTDPQGFPGWDSLRALGLTVLE